MNCSALTVCSKQFSKKIRWSQSTKELSLCTSILHNFFLNLLQGSHFGFLETSKEKRCRLTSWFNIRYYLGPSNSTDSISTDFIIVLLKKHTQFYEFIDKSVLIEDPLYKVARLSRKKLQGSSAILIFLYIHKGFWLLWISLEHEDPKDVDCL